jgi:hypothetical protein
VLAGFCGIDTDLGMPGIVSGNNYRINILSFEHLAIIDENIRILEFQDFSRRFPGKTVEVTDSHKRGVSLAGIVVDRPGMQMEPRTAGSAQADDSDTNSVIRSCDIG